MPDPGSWLSRNRDMIALAFLIVVGGLGVILFLLVLPAKHDRRYEVYEIANRLERGMSHAQVEQVLHDYWRPYMKRSGRVEDGDGAIQVIASFGWAEALYLTIYFEDGELIGTRMHGEDSPEDRYDDQPQDIPISEVPYKALHPTAYPLRSLPAAELNRWATREL